MCKSDSLVGSLLMTVLIEGSADRLTIGAIAASVLTVVTGVLRRMRIRSRCYLTVLE